MNKGMRLNRLGEATERVAQFLTLMSTTSFDRKAQAPTARYWALNVMLGVLHGANCDGKILHRGHFAQTKALEKLWRAFGREFGGSVRFGKRWNTGSAGQHPDWGIEMVVSPLDGAARYIKGDSCGSLSALAYGPPGSFIAEDHPIFTGGVRRFLVFVVGRGYGQRALDLQSTLDREMRQSAAVDEWIDAFIDRFQPGQGSTCATNVNERGARDPDIATSTVFPAIMQRPGTRMRADPGSSLGSALGALHDGLGIDFYLGVMRTAEAIQLAVAAHARGGHLLALPLLERSDSKSATQGEDSKPVRASVEREVGESILASHHTLVPGVAGGHDVAVCVTGVSENSTARATRYSGNRIRTETLCLYAGSASTRSVRSSADVTKRPFPCAVPLNGDLGAKFAGTNATIEPIVESSESRLPITAESPVTERSHAERDAVQESDAGDGDQD